FFKRKVFVHTAMGVRKNTRIRNDAGPMIREGGYGARGSYLFIVPRAFDVAPGPVLFSLLWLYAIAARTRFSIAYSSTLSFSRKSIALHTLPSRPALKSLSWSGRLAPRAKVSFTLSLWAFPTAMIPSRDHTGLPIHFHSSMISSSVSRIV